ncbi:MAG: cell division protein FtsK, partial [Actinobacteria bacterium HGW-Actinobacteria-8]
MALRLTLAKGDGSCAGLAILAAPDTTVGDVAAQLFASDPSRAGVDAPEDPTLLVTPLSMGPHAAPRTVDRDLDLASSGIRSGDHLNIVPSADAAGLTGPRAVATVTVVEGPDVGKSFALGAGSHTIGRGLDASVRLSDGMVSRRHARLLVGESLEVVDMGSTCGLALGEAYVTRATLAPGDRIEVGSTILEVSRSEAIHHAAPTATTVPLTRSPRVLPPLPQGAVELPQPPTRPTPRRFPGIALVAPIVLGTTMFVVTGRVLSLLFIAMAPMMMVGTWWDARRVQKRELRDAGLTFDASLEEVRREIEAAHAAERAARVARSPSFGDVLDAVNSLSPLVWATRPEHDEFLTVRVGVGESRSLVDVVMPARSESYPGFWGRLRAARDAARNVSPVPITVDLRLSANVGLVGDIVSARAAARAIVTHLAGMHSPLEVVVASFASPVSSRDWAWLWWLPHCSSPASPVGVDHLADSREGSARLLAALEGIVSVRHRVDISDVVPEPRAAVSDTGPEPPRLPAIVVVVEDDATADRNRLMRLAERGPDVNVHLVWLAPRISRIPAACRTFVEVHAEGPATVGHVRRGGYDEPVTLESLTLREATDVARRLACVEDAGAVASDTASVPSAVSFLDLHGFDALDPACHENRWRRDNALAARNQRPFSLRALVGHSGEGPVYLDLKTQGPHALVGGTTGAGKSEFLQSWVLGMAAAHGPDHVTFLFVDYKGGSAFSDCVNLPHSVGLVTDLTPQLVERALTSLRAELHYRERLLAAKGAKDLETLDRAGDIDAPPSLVIVIDEFAALVKEVPDFVDGLVDIAQRGRSLGLHLIMATQRPAGVIKDNLRANTNLRIALRMADEADSSDILGVRDAAHVDPSLPGRYCAAGTFPGASPHHGHTASDGRHQGQPSCQHQSAHRTAYGRRGGLVR